MITIKDLIKAEFIKSKIGHAYLLSILIPIGVSFFTFWSFSALYNYDPDSGVNPWIIIFGISFRLIPFIYSLFSIYIVQDNLNRDYANNLYDILFTFPIKKSHFYISKIIYTTSVLAFSILLTFLITITAINVFEFKISETNGFYEYGQSVFFIYSYSYFRLFLYALVIVLLQLNINKISRNPVTNIIIPMGLSFISFILSGLKEFSFFPYAYIHTIHNSIDVNGEITKFYVDALAFILCVILIVFYMRWDEKVIYRTKKKNNY